MIRIMMHLNNEMLKAKHELKAHFELHIYLLYLLPIMIRIYKILISITST